MNTKSNSSLIQFDNEMRSPFSVHTVDLFSASFGLIDLACVEGDPDIIDDDNNDVLLECEKANGVNEFLINLFSKSFISL